MQRKPIPFAGVRWRRPSRRGSASPRGPAGRTRHRAIETTARNRHQQLQQLTPASHATRGVRVDRVGAKLPRRAIATRGANRRALALLVRPLAREISAGSLREPPVLRRRSRKGESAEKASLRGDPRRGVRGSGDSSVVLVDRGQVAEVDKRRAAVASEVKNLASAKGLVAPGESRGAVNTRREPGRGGKARGTGGGLSPRKRLRESGPGRGLVGGRRSGPAKPPSLTRRWWTRSSVPRAMSAHAGKARGATGSVRGPSPASFAVDNAAAK